MVITEPEKPIRILMLLGAPFTVQNFERIGIPYLSKHFEVMVFDCTEWLGRSTENIVCKKAHWQNFVAIKNEIDLEVQLKKYCPQYAIDCIGFGDRTLNICRILAKNNVKFIVQKTGSLPIPELRVRVKNILIDLMFRKKSKEVIADLKRNTTEAINNNALQRVNKLISKIKTKLQEANVLRQLNSYPAYIGLLGGYKSIDRFTSRSKPIIWIGSNDYHTFNKVKNELALNCQRQISEPFILFIDDNLPKASDWLLLGINPPVTASLYYPALHYFFEKIESLYDMPVKIAGHPNSVSDKEYQVNMRGRSVIFGETAALALQSTIVLIHGSTAASFAVLARKPIVSLTSQELDQVPYGQHIRTMSDNLGTPLAYIDQSDVLEFNLNSLIVDETKYSLYKANYLCNELSNENEPWGELINYINNQPKLTGKLDLL